MAKVQIDNLPKCIILLGYARSGKDTAADYFSAKYGYTKKASGRKMRDLLEYMPIYIEHIEKDGTKLYKTFKEWTELFGYEYCKDNITGYRKALVGLGHGAREILYQNIWIDRSLEDVEKGQKIVVSDGRYQSEIEKAQKLGGIAIEIMRTKPVNDTEKESMSKLKPDYLLDNRNISIEEFKVKLDKIIELHLKYGTKRNTISIYV